MIPINTPRIALEPAQTADAGRRLLRAVTHHVGRHRRRVTRAPGNRVSSTSTTRRPGRARRSRWAPSPLDVCLLQQGRNDGLGRRGRAQQQARASLIPVAVATHKPGTPIKLGVAPGAYALTPNGQTARHRQQQSSSTDLDRQSRRRARWSRPSPVGATPTGLDIDATGTTAWVASCNRAQAGAGQPAHPQGRDARSPRERAR